MPKTVHVIGNGDSAVFYNEEPKKGLKLACNKAPFPIENCYASCIVDFKMMHTINSGVIDVPGEWILGARPKVYMEKNPNFHMKRSHQIKMFFTKLPKYAANFTDLNCGHMAVYFAALHLKAERIHMYGFDSIFDFNLRSYTDLFINSDRGGMNNNRLTTNWRPLWNNMFKDFSEKGGEHPVDFIIHHKHNNLKFKVPDNVHIETYGRTEEITRKPEKDESVGWKPPADGIM
jgi:hypothetical protein